MFNKKIIFIILLCTFFIYDNIPAISEALTFPDRLLVPSGSDECQKLDGNIEKLSWNNEGDLIWEASIGDRVLFSFPLPQGSNFSDYGLCKFDLKIEGGPC